MNTLEQLLETHFSSNFYPALPTAYVAPAVEALEWVRQGEFEVIVSLPKNINPVPKNARQHNDEVYITASDLVDALQIHSQEFYELLPVKA